MKFNIQMLTIVAVVQLLLVSLLFWGDILLDHTDNKILKDEDVSKIDEIMIKNSGDQLITLNKKNKQWRVGESSPADPIKVDALLSKLVGITIAPERKKQNHNEQQSSKQQAEFQDPLYLAKRGVDQTVFERYVEFKASGEILLGLYIGEITPNDARLSYVRKMGQKRAYKAQIRAEMIPMEEVYWRDKKVTGNL